MFTPQRLPLLYTALLGLTLLLAIPLAAQEEISEDDFWETYDDITDWVSLRLKLTPEQEKTVLPVLDKNFQRKQAMLEEYGFRMGKPWPKLDVKQRQEVDARMMAIRMETRAQLVDILNSDQLEELKKIQLEYHKAFTDRLAMK